MWLTIVVTLLLLGKAACVYMIPFIKTVRLQSESSPNNSNENRLILLYWCVVCAFMAIEKIPFIPEYGLYAAEIIVCVWLYHPRTNGLNKLYALWQKRKPKAKVNPTATPTPAAATPVPTQSLTSLVDTKVQ